MASPPPPRQQWLLEGAVAAFHHVLTISTRSRMYDQAEHWTLRSLLTTLALDVRGSLSVVSRVNLCVGFRNTEHGDGHSTMWAWRTTPRQSTRSAMLHGMCYNLCLASWAGGRLVILDRKLRVVESNSSHCVTLTPSIHPHPPRLHPPNSILRVRRRLL